MNTPNKSNTQTDLSRVLAKITEIANASATGDYIYRGEPKCYDEVSSNLYREYKDDIEADHFNIKVVQNEILREAKEYTTHKMDDLEILTALQHHGGKTNLIDFTTDYLVALFFACNKKPDKPGRVILIQRQSEAYEVVKPPKTITRAGVQKSIFVQAPSGIVPPNTVVYIPADLKGVMLDYLRKSHDISTKTIYNDLQGFIENWISHRIAYTEFYKGFTCQDRGDSAKNPEEKQAWYDKAVGHYTEAIDLHPQHAGIYNNRGIAYGKKGDFDRAIQDYNAAITLDPQHTNAYNNRGIEYDKKGEIGRAIQDYSSAIELNPEDVETYHNRGIAYGKKGDFDRAIQDFTKVIDLNPEYADAYNNRGIAYRGKSDLETAIRDFTKAMDLNPKFAETYHNRGIAYADKGEFDRAIQDFTKAIDLNPELAKTYYSRGNTYEGKGDLETAIQDYTKAIDLNPEYADAYNNRGIAYGKKGDFDRAIQDFTKAIDLNPQHTKAYTNRGKMWLHLQEWKKAEADLIIAFFHNDYESVADFEAKHGIQVPEDIAALLSRD